MWGWSFGYFGFWMAWSVLWASAGLADPATKLHRVETLSAAAGVHVTVTLGKPHSIQTLVHQGDLDRLELVQEGTNLLISRDTSSGPNGAPNLDRFEVHMTLPQLGKVTARTGAQVKIRELFTSNFTASSETGALIEVSDAMVGVLELDVATGGDIRVDGTCWTSNVAAATGGQVLADHLTCQSVEASASDGATARLFATGTADLSAQKGATLVLSGTAVVVSQRVESWATIRDWSSSVSN